jgi:ribosomal protein S18 acetylase RimI-like enzyme
MNDHLPSIPGFNRLEVSIRPMRPSDTSAVIELDARVLGKPRAAYFERRLAALEHADTGRHLIFLVADYRDEMLGFVMGTLASGEFGLTQVTAIIDSIGVHPRYQRQHIGQQLIEAFLSQSTSLGAKAAYTLVQWENWELLKVFHALGFTLASTTPLERQIG